MYTFKNVLGTTGSPKVPYSCSGPSICLSAKWPGLSSSPPHMLMYFLIPRHVACSALNKFPALCGFRCLWRGLGWRCLVLKWPRVRSVNCIGSCTGLHYALIMKSVSTHARGSTQAWGCCLATMTLLGLVGGTTRSAKKLYPLSHTT